MRLETARRIDDSFNAPFPGPLKINARNIGKKIEPARIVTEAKKIAWFGEVFRPNAVERYAVRGECCIHRLRICGVRFYE